MEEHIHISSNEEGLQLGALIYYPDTEIPKGIIQFAHGMCGCKERFIPAMKYLSEAGFICIANDHRGHGESIIRLEDLGYMYDGGWSGLVDDMKIISNYISTKYPDLKLYLIGHSMGSLASRIYASRYGEKLEALFLCGSPYKSKLATIGRNISKLLCKIEKGYYRPVKMQKISSSMFNIKFKQEGTQAWTCSDPKVRKSFADNPLCNFNFTANGSYNLLSMMETAYNNKKTPAKIKTLPIILMNGKDDPCSNGAKGLKEAAKQCKRAGYTNIRTICYPHMRHEILNEFEYKKVLDDIMKTILQPQ